MFNCEFCKCTSKSGEKENVVVVKTRPKEYKYQLTIYEDGRRKKINKESSGFEVVNEIKVCYNCNIKANEEI